MGAEGAMGAVGGREEGGAVAVIGEGSVRGGVAAGGAVVAVAVAVAVAAAAAEAGGESEPASSAEIARRSVLVRACHSK